MPTVPPIRDFLEAHSVLSTTPARIIKTTQPKQPISSYLSIGSSMDSDIEAKAETEAVAPSEWKPTKNELLVMVSLSFISLMVALDATVLVTVLPVCAFERHQVYITDDEQEIAHSLNGTSAEAFWAGTS